MYCDVKNVFSYRRCFYILSAGSLVVFLLNVDLRMSNRSLTTVTPTDDTPNQSKPIYNEITTSTTMEIQLSRGEIYKYYVNPSDLCLYFSMGGYSRKRCAITSFPKGRLGNVMGQYATLIGLAYINKRPAYLQANMAKRLDKYFKISLPSLPKGFEPPWELYGLDDWMENRHKNIPGQYVQLDGYTTSWTFYHGIKDFIRKEFTFHDKIKEKAQKILRAIQRQRNKGRLTFVGVHVRRTDYVTLMKTQYRGVVADVNYLNRAADYFRGRYNNVVFIVSSDDIEWCMENIDNSRFDVHFEGINLYNNAIDDFALLASCNHSIITIGTYGYWAAYLAGGETVYLFNYTMPDSKFMKVLKYEDYYLPEWIPMAANLSEWSTK